MSGGLALLVLAAVLVAVGWPLFARAPVPLGRGLEDDTPVLRWEAERARLIDAMRDNDMALAEGRLDPATHQGTAARLGDEAERVLTRLRAARGQFATPEPAPRHGRAAPVLALAFTLAAGVGAAQLARWQDIDLTGSPHADGSVPLDLPMMADGGPDIGAMVASLESRVAEGGASPDEIKMLLRSYDTLGRMEDARPVLDGALARFPDDPDFQLGWLRIVITLPQAGDTARALPVAERLIAAMPDLLEAHWYRSLLLVAEGRRDEALVGLMWMAPRLPAGSPAHSAVNDMIAELSRPPG